MTSDHVVGLSYSESVRATWVIAPGTDVPVRDLALTPADCVILLRRHPELFPSWVGESLDGLTG